MKYFLAILVLISPLGYSCENESQIKTELSAKVLQRDVEAIDVAILYPDMYKEAAVDSISLVVYQKGEFYMTFDSVILKHNLGLKNVDLESYSWSYISVKESALEDIEVVVNYRWPPAEDGSIIMCGPELRERLVKLVKGV